MLRVGLEVDDLQLQHVLDGLLQTVVLRAAARQRDAVRRAGLLRHDKAALRNRHLDARRDLVRRLAFAHQRDDLGLGKHRALRRDGDHVLRRQAQLRKLRQAQLKAARHRLEEAPRAGSALVVHRKVLHRAVRVDADALDVLAADVDDRLDLGIRHMHAHGMAGDLGNVLVREGNLVAPVARADQVLQVLAALQADLGQHFVHRRNRRLLGIDLAANGGIGYHLAVLVQNDRLRVGGTYVTTAEIFHYSVCLR